MGCVCDPSAWLACPSRSRAFVMSNVGSARSGLEPVPPPSCKPANVLSPRQELLAGKMFLGGARPDAEDTCVYSAAASLPASVLRSAPMIKGWLNTVGMFAPSMRAGWGVPSAPVDPATKTKPGTVTETRATKAKPGAIVGAAESSSRAVPTPAGENKKVDDLDDLFEDDESEELKDRGGETAAVGRDGAKTRAEQMAEAKAAKNKAKKVDRCVFMCIRAPPHMCLSGVLPS